tara:strand:- start:1270 stop:2205 length:936 start_codon:yes stop_codon:yes gene_type:complete
MSRIQLANHFKTQAFEAIGVNPQRMGQEISRQSATGVQQAVQASYSQTEMYFIQHSDNLMPRVHQMRTDLSQYYHSRVPSVRLNYISSEAEKVNFTINGTELLMRDFNVFCTTRTNHRATLDQLKQLAMSNNTSGASIYDLGNLIKAESIAEVSDILKDAELKQQQQQQAQQQSQEKMQQEQLAAQQQEQQAQREFENIKQDKEIQKDITVAEIRAAGYGAQTDLDENKMSDFRDSMKEMRQRDQYQDQMNFKRDQAARDDNNKQQKLNLDRDKMNLQREVAQTNLEIARENKNRFDNPKKSEKKDKKKKK